MIGPFLFIPTLSTHFRRSPLPFLTSFPASFLASFPASLPCVIPPLPSHFLPCVIPASPAVIPASFLASFQHLLPSFQLPSLRHSSTFCRHSSTSCRHSSTSCRHSSFLPCVIPPPPAVIPAKAGIQFESSSDGFPPLARMTSIRSETTSKKAGLSLFITHHPYSHLP